MVNQMIEVELSIIDRIKAEEEMTNLLLSLIKVRLNKYPESLQMLICNMLLDNQEYIDRFTKE